MDAIVKKNLDIAIDLLNGFYRCKKNDSRDGDDTGSNDGKNDRLEDRGYCEDDFNFMDFYLVFYVDNLDSIFYAILLLHFI